MAGRVVFKALLLLSSLAPSIGASHTNRHHHGPRAYGAEARAGLEIQLRQKFALRDRVIGALSKDRPKLERRLEVLGRAVPTSLNEASQDFQEGLNELEAAFQEIYSMLATQPLDCSNAGSAVAPATTAAAAPTVVVYTEYSTTDVYATNSLGPTVDGTLATAKASIGVTHTTTTAFLPTFSSNGTYLNTTSRASNATYTNTTSLPTNVSSSSVATPTFPPSSNVLGAYIFDPMASSNVAVYYGQSDISSQVSLDTVCNDNAVDIVVLAFITSFDGGGGYPTLNLGGSGCWAATAAQTAAGATGLIDCTEKITLQIQTCQDLGKPVLLSIGGATGDVIIPNAASAATYADTLWNLFGPGSGLESIRPFGNVSVDGFDFDNEADDDIYFDTLITSLRTRMSTASRPMYLSAAPQCPINEYDVPFSSLQSSIDFVWVQFYNNDGCDLKAGSAFLDSVSTWSADLNTTTAAAAGAPFININNGVTSPRLYIGAPSFPAAGEHAYTPAADLAPVIQQVKQLGLANLGGGMLWNAEYGEENKDSEGRSFVSVFKEDFV